MDIDGAQSQIDAFVTQWQGPLFERCDNNQKLASWYLWIGYLMKLRSLRHLVPSNDTTGCYIMARYCLEHDVALTAVAKDAALGDRYVDYDVHAKNKHLETMRGHADANHVAGLEQYMVAQFGSDFAKKKAPNWHGGIPTLCRTAGRSAELQMYVALCQVAHGTVTGMYMLNVQGMMGEQYRAEVVRNLLMMYTLSYLKRTEEFIDLVFGSVWTPDQERCSDELIAMIKSIAL